MHIENQVLEFKSIICSFGSLVDTDACCCTLYVRLQNFAVLFNSAPFPSILFRYSFSTSNFATFHSFVRFCFTGLPVLAAIANDELNGADTDAIRLCPMPA